MPLIKTDDGTSLCYDREGSGVPVVFVHEFAGTLFSWREQIETLRGRADTIAYNCRGYPPSSVPIELASYSQDRSVRDLACLLDVLKIESVILVGLSMGGNIALNFALRHPSRVISAVIAATGGGSDDPQLFARTFEGVARQLENGGPAAIADAYLSTPTRIQLKRKAVAKWRQQHAEFSALSGLGLANTIRGAIIPRQTIYSLGQEIEATPVPLLVFVGDEDEPTIGPSRFIAEKAPRGRLVVFPKSGHNLNLEEPARFNALLEEQLDHARTARPAAP